MKVNEESENENAVLKLKIQKTKIMMPGSITSWQIDGETMERVIDSIFLGSKITSDGDCNYKIKRYLFHGKKSYDKLRQHIKKRRHSFANKLCPVKTMVFPVVMYGCESWTIKKAEPLKN